MTQPHRPLRPLQSSAEPAQNTTTRILQPPVIFIILLGKSQIEPKDQGPEEEEGLQASSPWATAHQPLAGSSGGTEPRTVSRRVAAAKQGRLDAHLVVVEKRRRPSKLPRVRRHSWLGGGLLPWACSATLTLSLTPLHHQDSWSD